MAARYAPVASRARAVRIPNDEGRHRHSGGLAAKSAIRIAPFRSSQDSRRSAPFAQSPTPAWQLTNRDAGSILERMRTGFQDLVLPVEGVELRCTFSGGAACSSEFDERTLSAESLVERADRRLYAAKRAGRNRIVSDEDLAAEGADAEAETR